MENKKQSLTFHYRDVPESDQPTYKERATSIIESYGYVANLAHAAVEAKPPVVWNKGSSFECVDVPFINIINDKSNDINQVEPTTTKKANVFNRTHVLCL